MHGGDETAVNQTVAIYSKYGSFPVLPFQLQVFLSQLKDYLYGQNNALLQWYTLIRPELKDSEKVVYGMQTYQRIIGILNNETERNGFPYKSLHDFILHKWQLLIRLEYIQKHYDIGKEYDRYVLQIKKVYDLLEQVRLLNMKCQMARGHSAWSLCHDPVFLAKLKTTLLEAYRIEMEAIPEIYRLLTSAAYPKDYLDNYETMTLALSDGEYKEGYFVFDFGDRKKYVYRIDIVRNGEYVYAPQAEKILLNNEITHYVECDSRDHLPVRTIPFKSRPVQNIKFYTAAQATQYRLVLFLVPGQSKTAYTLQFSQDRLWQDFHDIRNVKYDASGMRFHITGTDPYMTYDHLGINADTIKYIHIRMKTNDSSDASQLFFSTVENPYISSDQSVTFRVIPDGEMRTYTIDMREHPNWKGLVRSIRFDPADYEADACIEEGSRECGLEFIKFTKEKAL
ncbi:MAG: hypothetical protein ACLSVG_06705 [Clostridia bacterium]